MEKLPRTITVCDACLRACCWHGEDMCERAASAGIVRLTIAELRALNREHPDNWSAKKLRAIYGGLPA